MKKEKQPKSEGREKGNFFARLFKKDKPQIVEHVRVTRFHALASEGLSTEQVNERISQGLVNKTVKKYSKTYRSIFVGNICTFFNCNGYIFIYI